MSNSVFQSIIVQLKDVTDRVFGVIDHTGTVVSSTEVTLLGEKWKEAAEKVATGTEQNIIWDGKTFRSMASSGNGFEYAVFCQGEDEQARVLCAVAHIALSDAKYFYEEKHDRGTFIKNVIMDNILPGDIYIRAKELRFATDAPRAVFLVRDMSQTEAAMVEKISALFPDKMQDFVLSINETDVAVIKQLTGEPTPNELHQIALSIEKAMKKSQDSQCVIGIGTVAFHLRELADAYKEAQTAIEVGRVFDEESSIISYDKLGIGRLIYQLPTTLCEIFLTEVFKKNTIDSLDEEILFTINKFFENNLNVSETSRKLYVHRNTLVYRLEKINKLTGLDLRRFDHAIIFRVALMVRKYLSSRDVK